MSCYGISVNIGKIYVFCDIYCVHSGKCVSIVVKIKYAGNMSDICDKLNFIINYTHFIKKHIY